MSYDAELRLTPRLKTILNAHRTGAKDARVSNPRDPSVYGARPNSMWADHYRMGFDGLPLPQEVTTKGITA